MVQLENKWHATIPTYAPPGLFGRKNAAVMAWRPSAYLDSLPQGKHLGIVYGPLLPTYAQRPLVRHADPSDSTELMDLTSAATSRVDPDLLQLFIRSASSWSRCPLQRASLSSLQGAHADENSEYLDLVSDLWNGRYRLALKRLLRMQHDSDVDR